jgi:CheY-like chemotaxis protein
MPEGGQLTIETRMFELDPLFAETEPGVVPGRYVMLAVTDTGTGMDAPTRLQIFEPFFTTKGPGEGTGLGLSTVYGIVKQSGGHIWVYSELGRGTTFKICLPRADGETASAPAPAEPAELVGGTETVLIVEDEAAVRDLAARVLRERGYTVYTAASVDEALARLRRPDQGIELLITDVVLPGRSGTALAEEAARVRPELPVLFMSGYAHSTLARQGVLDPELILIEKPFTGATLTRKVRQALDTRR